jgi:hypothetical protein
MRYRVALLAAFLLTALVVPFVVGAEASTYPL